MGQYQALRALISDIIARYPAELKPELRQCLITARQLIREMEDYVERQAGQELGTNDRSRLNQQLNGIHSDLESISGAMALENNKGD